MENIVLLWERLLEEGKHYQRWVFFKAWRRGQTEKPTCLSLTSEDCWEAKEKKKKKSSVDLVQALHRVHLPLQSGVTEDILLSVLYWSGSLQSLQVRGKKKLELLLQVCSNLAICRCVMPHYTLLVYWPAHQLTWLNFFQLYYFYKWIIFFWPPLSMPSE